MFERLLSLSRAHHYHLGIEGDGNAGGGTGGDAGAGDQKLPASDGAAADTMLTGDDAGADPAGGAADAEAPDWRAKIAGDDAKELAWLKRFTTEENYHKNVRALRQRMSAGIAQSGPPEDATDAEIAAYRKTAGIPEKAEGYGLAFPEGAAPTEADTAALAGFAEHMHAAHMTPAAAKTAFAFYAQKMAEAREAQAEFVRDAEAETRAELRAEWGPREFTRNIAIGYEFLEKHMGDKAASLAGLRLADGRPLGKHPDFNRLLVSAGRATADEEALIGGDGGGGGKSIDDEFNELVQKAGRRTPAEEKRALQLAEAKVAREERQGRGRAA